MEHRSRMDKSPKLYSFTLQIRSNKQLYTQHKHYNIHALVNFVHNKTPMYSRIESLFQCRDSAFIKYSPTIDRGSQHKNLFSIQGLVLVILYYTKKVTSQLNFRR